MHKVKFSNLYSRFCNQEYREKFNDEYVQMINDIKDNKMSLNIQEYVKVYNSLLEKDHCDKLVEELKNEKYKVKLASPFTDLIRRGSVINTNPHNLKLKSLVDDILEKVSKEVGKRYCIDVRPFFYSYGEKLDHYDFQVLQYDKDDFFRVHHDHYAESTNFSRLLTVCIYLNDDYEGGNLDFPSIGKSFRFNTGDVIVFPSNWMFYHGVTPITSGTRFSIVMWLGVSTEQVQ